MISKVSIHGHPNNFESLPLILPGLDDSTTNREHQIWKHQRWLFFMTLNFYKQLAKIQLFSFNIKIWTIYAVTLTNSARCAFLHSMTLTFQLLVSGCTLLAHVTDLDVGRRTLQLRHYVTWSSHAIMNAKFVFYDSEEIVVDTTHERKFTNITDFWLFC